MKESDLQKQILDYLSYQNGVFWRINSGGIKGTRNGKDYYYKFNSMAGISDIIGIMPNGTFFACEVKIGKNKPTKIQQEFIDMIRSNQGIAFVAYELEDVRAFFE